MANIGETPSLAPIGTWVDPGVDRALCWLLLDDRKGNARRCHLPGSLYKDNIAPFLRFDAPIHDQLYALGGRNEEQGPLDVVEMFDTWHGCWVSCPNMLVRRGGCAGATLPDGRLLVTGGYDARGIVHGILESCEFYDAHDQKWSMDIAPMRRARWGHGCATLRDLVYVVGGCALAHGAPPSQDFMETLTTCEAYDYKTDRWVAVADLSVARGGSRVVAIGDHHLAAVGGCDDVFGRADMLATVELFDPDAAQWFLLDSRLSVPRTTAAVAALDDNKLLVVGGASVDVAVALASAEVYSLPESSTLPPNCSSGAAPNPDLSPSASTQGAGVFEAAVNAVALSVAVDAVTKPGNVANAGDGRMGCQAIAMNLPAPGEDFPLRTRRCVVVVGGEEDEGDSWDEYEDAPLTRQFSSVLVYDTVEKTWKPESAFPPMPTPRTAMALCVGPGRVSLGCKTWHVQTTEPPAKRRRSSEGVEDTPNSSSQ